MSMLQPIIITAGAIGVTIISWMAYFSLNSFVAKRIAETTKTPPVIDTSKGTPTFTITDGPVHNYITVAQVHDGRILISITGDDGKSASVLWTKDQAAKIGAWISDEAAKP